LSRNLIMLDLLLAALCGLAGWRIAVHRDERLAEQKAFLERREPPAPAPAVLLPSLYQPSAAGSYVEVAQKLLLSVDRNPSVIVEVVPPKQMPPLPRAYGAMDFGGGPRVFLSSKPGDPQRPYAPGDQIGDFKLLAISRAGVVLEWEGKEVAASFEQMKDTAAAQPRAAQAPAPRQQPQPATASREAPPSTGLQTVAASPATPGRPAPGDGPRRGCAPGDSTPVGTIVDGFRRKVIDTPMGKGCFWEKVQ
jgi:hypothetical protein